MTTVTNDGVENTLPFSKVKQEALLGYFLTDPKLFTLAKTKIEPEWWSNPRHSQIWDLALKFSERVGGRAPSREEIENCVELDMLDLADTNAIRFNIEMSVKRIPQFGLDALRVELTSWLHARIYLSAMKKSESLFNASSKTQDSKKLQEAFAVIREMNRTIDETTFEVGAVESMDDPVGDFTAHEKESKNAISLGCPVLDSVLLDEGDGSGSLLRGDMTVLLAPTNIGKTTTMVTIIAHNVMHGKDCLLITHEGRIRDIKLKIWQALMGASRRAILNGISSTVVKGELAYWKKIVAEHLEFVPLNKAGLNVEDVEVMIRRRQEHWISKHGKGFDLLVDDYAAKLQTKLASRGGWAPRQIQEVVYNYFSQIALEHDCHVITAIQTNRDGSKVNRHAGSEAKSRLLVMEDVMEAWGPMTTATNVITINRDPASQARGVVTYYICKSRSSAVGVAVMVESDFASSRSHWADKRATWYRGTMSMSDKVSDLLSQFGGLEVPWATVQESGG